MKTVLQINTTLNFGSTGRIAEQIALLAQKDGWNCYIAHGARYVNHSQIKSIQIGTKLGNILHAAIGEFFGIHGFGSTIATWWFLRKIKRMKPDIIHLHNIHGYYINIRLLFNFLAKEKIPVVWTLHDCWSFTGHCTHFENEGCYKWITECARCPLLMAQYKSRIVDRSKKNYFIKKSLYDKIDNMTIVPVSNWLGELVTQSILKRHRVQIIRNGIDLSLFSPSSSEIKDKLNIGRNQKMILGVVSSGFKGKLEFAKLSENKQYKIVIVGVKKEWMADIPSSIICISRTNNQKELAEYYSTADVFVNPTYDDTFPTTNLEALACGTPVVTYQSGGSPETIDKDTGIAVKRRDFLALTNAIEEILRLSKEEYSESCRKRAEKLFNKDERFQDYVTLYQRILDEQTNM